MTSVQKKKTHCTNSQVKWHLWLDPISNDHYHTATYYIRITDRKNSCHRLVDIIWRKCRCLWCYRWLLSHWQWLYLLSGPVLHLRVGELVFLMRKSLSNLPPVLSGNVSTDVSGSFFTLPVTQRPLSNAFLISPFKKACDAGHEEVNEINSAVKAFGISCILPNIWQLFLIPNLTSEMFIYIFIHCFYLKNAQCFSLFAILVDS